MIITFCARQNNENDEGSSIADLSAFNDNEENEKILGLDGLESQIGRGRYRKRSLRRKRSHTHERTKSKPQLDAFHGEIQNFLEENKKPKPEKHIWTAVLVKNNNVSALKFVEYASFLMKYGYDVTKGELVSFGKCDVIHK